MKKTSLIVAGVLVLASAGALFLYQNARIGDSSGGAGKSSPGALQSGTQAGTAPRPGSPAPAFSLKDINGNVIDSGRFRGKPTVVNFFATWCPPCREEMPGFVDVYNKYRDKGFELVAISLDTDTRGNLPSFVTDHRIEFRILMGDLSMARAYGGVSSIPTTFFIGKDGLIRYVHVGYLDRDSFDREVEKLL